MNSGCHDVGIAHRTAPTFPDREEILSRLKKYPRKPYFPPAAERKAWQKLPPDVRRKLIQEGEKSAKAKWPLLTARDYMRFRRSGDRASYEKVFFQRRSRLIDLVAAECCEHRGRFMDDIVEGLWQILSEPAWCMPAHEGLAPEEVLPDPARFKVDLADASTGKLLTDTLSLLGPELTKISPALVKRVKMELLRRVVEPAEKLNDENTWWFCGRNNWTPSCSSNIIGCALYLLNDQPERLADLIHTYLGISRRFYDRYPADGGCDEGPAYWRGSVGRYFLLLDLLDRRLHLEGRLFRDEKLRRMCEYPVGMNLCGRWFLSTSDAVPKPDFPRGYLSYMARRIGSAPLAGLARRLPPAKKDARAPVLDNLLLDLLNPVAAGSDQGAFSAVDFWPGLGIAILREKPEKPERGTVLSLKGGSNGESHNHLDLGNFTLMRGGKFLVVDVGAGVYTAQTFSEKRYLIWHIGAEGHNPPRFSGVMQTHGAEYRAVLAMTGDDTVTADLAKAYPPAAGVEKLTRKAGLDRRTGNVLITDTAEVGGNKKIGITLYTPVEPEKSSADKLQWKQGTLQLENLKISGVSEEPRLDAKLKKTWGRLWKIELAGEIRKSGCWKMKFDFVRTKGK